MADKQISDLTSASALTDGSLFVLEQAGAAMNANWGMIKNYISPGVANQYSNSATYNVGNYVIYNDQLYRCTTAITTPESWTAAHWTHVLLGDDVAGLDSNVADILHNVVDLSAVSSVETGGVDFQVKNPYIVSNGTASRNILLNLAEGITGYSRMLLLGGPAGGSGNTYFLGVYKGGTRVGFDVGAPNGTEIMLDPAETYRVRAVFISGASASNVVFTPRAYVGGMLLDVEAKADKRYRWLSGHAFITECGSKIFVDSKSFRVYDKINKTYLNAVSTTVELAGDTSSPSYILFDGSTFTVSTKYSETAIAYVYRKITYPIIEGIIPGYRCIQDGYIRSGSEYYINYKRTPIDAIGQYSYPDMKVSERGYIYKSSGSKVYNIGNHSMSFTLTENTVDISNKKILMIGDSFVARGYLQNWLHSFNDTLQFIGSRDTQYYGYKSEGVSGSRLYYFTDPSTSPFYFNGALDFCTYLSENNLSIPDYVVINSAINHTVYDDSDHGTYLQNLSDLVEMITNYSNTIKIYVTFGANYATEPGSTYGYPSLRFVEVRKCCNSVYDVNGVTVVPVDYALVDELDYPYETYDYFGDDISLLSDCVHPKENTGFKKIARMIYNYLGA